MKIMNDAEFSVIMRALEAKKEVLDEYCPDDDDVEVIESILTRMYEEYAVECEHLGEYEVAREYRNKSDSLDDGPMTKAFELLDSVGGYADYNTKIELVAEELGISEDEAESIVEEYLNPYCGR